MLLPGLNIRFSHDIRCLRRIEKVGDETRIFFARSNKRTRRRILLTFPVPQRSVAAGDQSAISVNQVRETLRLVQTGASDAEGLRVSRDSQFDARLRVLLAVRDQGLDRLYLREFRYSGRLQQEVPFRETVRPRGSARRRYTHVISERTTVPPR